MPIIGVVVNAIVNWDKNVDNAVFNAAYVTRLLEFPLRSISFPFNTILFSPASIVVSESASNLIPFWFMFITCFHAFIFIPNK